MAQHFPLATAENVGLYEIARKYYVEDQTMEQIAKEMSVSRSTISRMLKRATETGIVTIQLADPIRTDQRLAARLGERFGVAVQVITVRKGVGEVNRLEHVTSAAAQLIGDTMADGMRVGCAWGTTLASIVRYLPAKPLTDVEVVQINGGANATTSGIPYVGSIVTQFANAFGGRTVLFPVPTFFDSAVTRRAMWQERSIKPILMAQRSLDLAIFGVGSIGGPISSHVYVSGYLDDKDREALHRERVVGDVCTVFLREDGSWKDIDINSRATGLTPDELRRLEKRICVAAGVAKTRAVLGALRSGVATDLIVDDALAKAILAADGAPNGNGGPALNRRPG